MLPVYLNLDLKILKKLKVKFSSNFHTKHPHTTYTLREKKFYTCLTELTIIIMPSITTSMLLIKTIMHFLMTEYVHDKRLRNASTVLTILSVSEKKNTAERKD